MDDITWLENKIGLNINPAIKDVLLEMISREDKMDLRFGIGNYGDFTLFDFKTLSNKRDKTYVFDQKDYYTDPYLVINAIYSHLRDNVKKYTGFKKGHYFFPVAYCQFYFLVLVDDSPNPVLIDLDSKKIPKQLETDIHILISFQSVLSNTYRTASTPVYEQILDASRYFIMDAECIGDGREYEQIIKDFLGLTGGLLKLEQFRFTHTGHTIAVTITVSGKDVSFKLLESTDWLDGNIYLYLNDVLQQHNVKERFYQIHNVQFGQEICFGLLNAEEALALVKSGHVENVITN